jgi:hypothetical protein
MRRTVGLAVLPLFLLTGGCPPAQKNQSQLNAVKRDLARGAVVGGGVVNQPVHQTDTPPRIDGDLGDAAWKPVRPITDLVSCSHGGPARARTEVRLTYDKTYLYFSYRMEEPLIDSSEVRASVKEHDGEVWRDDRAETFFWFERGPGQGYYQLMVNMLGTTEDVRDGKTAWEPRWESAVKIHEQQKMWIVEARIAFSELGQKHPVPGTRWRVNFGRERYALPDHDSWAKITGSFHQKEAFNSITFWGRRERVPPAALESFEASGGMHHGEVVLSWKSTGDDGTSGRAATYDVRYSEKPVADEAAFSRAKRAVISAFPKPAGQPERIVLGRLPAGRKLYFAARAVDDSGNAGPLARAEEAITVPGGSLAPALLTIEPTLECAGIVVTLKAGDRVDRIRAHYRRASSSRWIPAHRFTLIDRRHAATSLFGLTPGAEHQLKLALGGQTSVTSFHTRPEFVFPEPLRVVEVRSDQKLRAAVKRALPGDEIRVHPGTYRGGLTITRSGTAEHPIVIRGVVRAADVGKPAWKVRGLPVIDGRGKTYNGVLIQGSRQGLTKHVVLSHLQVRNATDVGIHLEWAADCVVQRCQSYDNGRYANVHVNKGGPFAGRHLIQHNHIADLEHASAGYFNDEQTALRRRITYYGYKQDNYVGPGTVFRGNLVEGHVDAVHSSGDESDAPKVHPYLENVRRRWFNHSSDVYDNHIRDHNGDGVEADGVAMNQRVFRNRIERCQNAISVSPALPGPFFFLRNTARDYYESCAKLNTGEGRGIIRNLYFYHNTFARGSRHTGLAAGGAIMTIWRGTPSHNIVFRNNVFTGTRGLISFQGLAHKPDMDHDLWFSTRGEGAFRDARSVFSDGGVPWERRGLFADPKLGPDLRPGRASPTRDRGQRIPGINPRFSGSAPDLGAFEAN